VAFRGVMLEALKSFSDGQPAIGASPELRGNQAFLRSFEGMLPKGSSWEHLDTVQGQLSTDIREVQPTAVA
jgi:hypothetical protein